MPGDVILLTGFEPFGGEPRNPSIELAQALAGECFGGLRVTAQQLPCDFERAGAALGSAIDRCSPRLVLAMGLAAGRSGLSFERVAINLIDARIADNAGFQPIDQPVCSDGPAAFFSTLPVKRMVAAVRRAGIPASISFSAGSFVCNQVFYQLQRRLDGSVPPVASGFLHLPLSREQLAERSAAGGEVLPALSLDEMAVGLRAALHEATMAAGAGDADPASEGSLH